MQIVVNIEKKHFWVILLVVFAVSGVLIVRAYDSGDPSYSGHKMDEIYLLDLIPTGGNDLVDDCEIETGVNVKDWVNTVFLVDSGDNPIYVTGYSLCDYMELVLNHCDVI